MKLTAAMEPSSPPQPMQTEPTNQEEAARMMATLMQNFVNDGGTVPPELLEQYQVLAGKPFEPQLVPMDELPTEPTPMDAQTEQPKKKRRRRKKSHILVEEPAQSEALMDSEAPVGRLVDPEGAEDAAEVAARRRKQFKAIKEWQDEAKIAKDWQNEQLERFQQNKVWDDDTNMLREGVNRINLKESNERVKADIDNHTSSFTANMANWVAIGNSNRFESTLLGRMKFAWWVVMQMNSWVGIMNYSSRDQEIVIKVLEKLKNAPKEQCKESVYGLHIKTITALLQMCEGITVPMYKKEDFDKVLGYKPPTDEESKPLKGVLQPDFGAYGIDSKTGMPRNMKIGEVRMTIAEIWLKHPARMTYARMVFNPRPYWFIGSAAGNELNQWQGFTYTRDDVKDYTDWGCIGLFMNHIRFSWCLTDEEFCHIIAHWAKLFQEPWIKQELCIAVGGLEGSVKTWIFDTIGKLVGNHYCHLQVNALRLTR